MTRILQLLFFAAFIWLPGHRALARPGSLNEKDTVTSLLRLYEDDDFFNFWGHGTDNAYTNGSRIDYYYQPAHAPHGILGKFAPRAGAGSTDVYSWGLYEIMYTPNDLTRRDWQSNDYQYAGAIVAAHSRYSINAVKKYSVQTEAVAGIIGPSAFGAQLQSGVHRLIHYTQPMGWSHQFRNDVLVNLNFTAEKQLLAAGRWFTLVGGARVYGGTLQNGAALYPLILVGKMDPYFNGFFGRWTSSARDGRGRKKWQAYFLFKPELQYFAQNALLQGGLFTHNPNFPDGGGTGKPLVGAAVSPGQGNTDSRSAPAIQPWVPDMDYGFVFTRGAFGISLTQNVAASALRNLYCHDVGNITLYFGL